MKDDWRAEEGRNSNAVQTSQNPTGNLTRLLLLGLAIGAGIVIAKQMPDLQRYLKMRSM